MNFQYHRFSEVEKIRNIQRARFIVVTYHAYALTCVSILFLSPCALLRENTCNYLKSGYFPQHAWFGSQTHALWWVSLGSTVLSHSPTITVFLCLFIHNIWGEIDFHMWLLYSALEFSGNIGALSIYTTLWNTFRKRQKDRNGTLHHVMSHNTFSPRISLQL